MRPGGGKQKGGAFERDVCKRLSLWMSRGLSDDWFWRSAMSGGRATLRHAKGKRNQTQVGDISAVHPQGARLTDRFVIECKYVKDLDLHGLFFPEQFGNLVAFWTTLQDVARRAGKKPMLIARQNFFPPNAALVCVCHSGNTILFPSLRYDDMVRIPVLDMCIVQLENVFLYGARP